MVPIAEYYGPFDAGAGANAYEADWSRIMRHALPTGVLDIASFALAAAPLQAFGDSTGMQVKVHPGAAAIHGHFYQNDAEQTKAVATADGSNPRIDRVVLRLNSTANTITVAVVTGTPAASPSAPALTQSEGGTWEIPLAQVAVAAGASTIAAGNVTDERGKMRSASSAPRGRLLNAPRGSTFGPSSAASATDIVTGDVYIPHDPLGRIVRVTLVVRGYSGSATGDQFTFRLGRNVTVIPESESVHTIQTASLTHDGFVMIAEDIDPPAGTHTYKAQVSRTNGSGTITITDSEGGATLLVDDVGGVV